MILDDILFTSLNIEEGWFLFVKQPHYKIGTVQETKVS